MENCKVTSEIIRGTQICDLSGVHAARLMDCGLWKGLH